MRGAMSKSAVINIVFAGLGGQGVLKASDITADVAFSTGLDVKKSELHGMSQRGGSVTSDIRYGDHIFSPMVPPGEADYLVVLAPDQVEVNIAQLKEGGKLIEPSMVDENKLSNKKSANVALLGILSKYLQFSDEDWLTAIKNNLPEKLYDVNVEAFQVGKNAA
jgi:indolepyruvate ferredoxin oxidoreductase beta subunit